MSRMLMIMMAVSLGTTACQKTKQRSYTPPPQPAAAPQAQPQQQGPIFNSPPPPPVQTDDTDGQIGQPGGPIVGPPAPPPNQDPPFIPPPNGTPVNPTPSGPPPSSTPPPAPPVNNNPPPDHNPPPPPPPPPPADPTPTAPPPVDNNPPPPPAPPAPTPSTPAPTPVPTNPLDIPRFDTQEPPPAPSPVDPNLPPPPAPLQPPPATQNPPNVNVNQEPSPPPPPAANGSGQPTTPPAAPPPPAAPTPTDPNQPVLKVNLNDEPKPLPIEPPPCLDPKGCGVVPVRPEEPPKQEDCRETRTCKPATPVVDRCTAPLEIDKKRNQLDILFVVDTSKSLTDAGIKGRSEGELAQIGQGMLEYVKSLDPETDYNIGVLTGHGPASPYFGKLIANDGPAVIKYSDIRRGRSTEQTQKEVARLLKRKMLSVPNESGGAQGEAMLLALYSIMDKSRLEQATHQGMFRSEAALNVIFVTDEQDVCFDYAGTDYKPTLKTKIVKGKKEQFEDPYERDFFKDVCSRAIGGKWDKKKHIMTPGEGFPVTPGRVAQRLQTLKNEASGGKLIMNAIVYNAPVPESLKGQVEDENEMAHGIIDFVQIFGQSDGIVSLADVYTKKSNFGPELSATGKLVKFRLKTENKFSCASNTHPDAINYTSLSAKLIDSRGQLVGVFSAACSKEASSCEGVTGSMDFRPMVDTRTGKSHAQIVVDPKALEYVIKTYNVEGGQWEVEFWTSSDRNREDGSQINGPIPAKKTSPRAQQSPDMRSASGKSKASAKARR